MTNRQGSLRGIGFEIVAIVGSILLAFAIDAWWDNKQESKEAHEILLGLQDEFRFHRSELLRHQQRWQRAEHSIERLLAAARTSDIPPVAVMDTLINQATLATTFDPRSGSTDALVASGRLELIDSRLLRTRLAAWGGVVEEVRDNELTMRDYVVTVLIPYLARLGVPLSRAHVLIPRGGLTDVRGERTWPISSLPEKEVEAVYRTLLADREFDGLMSTRYTWINVAEYGDALAFVDSLLHTIAEELQ